MENAAKALIMAGSILIAVLIIGVLVYMWASSSQMLKQNEKTQLAQQITTFNNEYEGYNRKLLRGTDVISAMNKAESNNKKYAQLGEENYNISVEFKMAEKVVYKKDGGTASVTFNIDKKYGMNDYINEIRSNSDAFTDFKRRIFDCKAVKYNNKTGRINYLLFEERKMEQEEYKFGL